MKKKKTLLSILFSAMLIPGTIAFVGCGTPPPTLDLQGSGTEANPYIIATAADLDKITKATPAVADLTQGKYFKLTANIGDAETPYATTIAGFAANFQGILDGDLNQYTITISGSTALFATNSGTIQNLNIAGTIVTEAEQTGTVGMLANINQGVIKNVTTSGTVTNTRGTVSDLASAEATGVGALVGTNDTSGDILNSTNNAQVSSKAGAGGFAAVNKGDISGVYNSGTIGMEKPSPAEFVSNTIQYSVMGGIAGINYGNILGANNKAFIFAPALDVAGDDYTPGMKGNEYVGGIAGYNKANAKISQTVTIYGSSSSIVFGDKYVGGVAGYNDGAIDTAIVTQQLGARTHFAGIASENGTNGTITSCAVSSSQERGSLGLVADAAEAHYYFISTTAENCIYNELEDRGVVPTDANAYTNCATGYRNKSITQARLDVLNTGVTPGQEKWFVVQDAGNSNPIVQPIANAQAMITTITSSSTDGTLASYKQGASILKNTINAITPDTGTAPDGKEFKGWSLTPNGEILMTDDATPVPQTEFTLTAGQKIILYAVYEDVPVVE